MKKVIWKFLNRIDKNINHAVVDWFFNFFECENEDGTETLSYKIWLATSYRYCRWVNDILEDDWNIEDYDKSTLL